MLTRQRRSRNESSVYWRQKIADWKQTGQTIRSFCRQRSVTESQFHLWKRRLGVKPTRTPAGRVKDPTLAFVPVSVASLRGSPITLRIHGATLRIEPGVDVGLLRAVLQSLKAS
jgi:hypothetical protein